MSLVSSFLFPMTEKMFDEIEQTFKARIVEVNETYSKNRLELKITFGTPRKAKYIPVSI